MNTSLFKQNAQSFKKWNNKQEFFEIDDIRKLPFTKFIYQHNRTIDIQKVKEIEDFLSSHFDKHHIVMTGAWTILLGRIPNNNYVCLDGQHRWNACQNWAMAHQIAVPIQFMVETFSNEEDMYESWRCYAGAREVPDHHRQKLGEKVGDSNVVVSLTQKLDERSFMETIIRGIQQKYPKLIRDMRKPPKPHLNVDTLEKWLYDVYEKMPSEPKITDEYRPNMRQPKKLLQFIIWLNDKVIQCDNETILQNEYLLKSSISHINEIKEIGTILGYQQIWLRIGELTRDKSRKWKSMRDSWIDHDKLSFEEIFHDA